MKKRLKKRVIKPATTVHHEDDMVVLHHGDALKVLRAMPDNSVHAVVTDPPYGLSNTDPKHVAEAVVQWAQGNREYVPHKRGGFMGKEWDSFVPPVAVWDECFRVLKPGGYLLSFAGSRTIDLMTLSVRLAGFDIRDTIMWLYGSGFPKSMDVSKAIDKAAGAERKVISEGKAVKRMIPGADQNSTGSWIKDNGREYVPTVTSAGTPEAAQWEGWGTALKPAHEPIVMARKPHKSTVANNVLEHGAGGLNIDATRISTSDKLGGGSQTRGQQMSGGWRRPWMDDPEMVAANAERANASVARSEALGRWPANVALDPEAAEALDQQSGTIKSGGSAHDRSHKHNGIYGAPGGERGTRRGPDSGGASRFFYVAKANKKERPVVDGVAHPTVKLIALMRWLVRMVTPPDGVVLDPFVGSGTTLEAAKIEGIRSVGIEAAEEYLPLAVERISRASASAAPERPKKVMRKRMGTRARMAPPSAR